MNPARAAGNPVPRTLLVRDVTAVPMARRGEVLEHVDILIEGGRIAAIGPRGTVPNAHVLLPDSASAASDRSRQPPGTALEPPAPALIEGRGRLALPGFVNAHNHVALALFKATTQAMPLAPWLAWLIPRQNRMTPDDLYWGSLLSCLEQTRAGVTTFADMFGRAERCAPAVEASGLRAVLSMSVMESDPRGDPSEGLDRLERSVAFALAWRGRSNGRITTRLAPHSVYTVRPSLLPIFAERAAQHGLGLQTHCSETRDEVRTCLAAHGATPPGLLRAAGCLELPILLAHAVHLTDEDIALLDRPNVGISHNPGSNLKLRSGQARLPDLVGRRLAVGLGTDSAASNDTQDILKELYLAAVLHAWPAESSPAWEVLELATIGGARALGLADEIGSLEPGKRADLILLDLEDPRHGAGLDAVRQLAYTARGADVTTTIVDGEVLMDDRVARRLDAQEILLQCRPRARRLLDD